MILTCVVLMSGKASIGSFRNDHAPSPASRTAMPRTARRRDSAFSTRVRSMAGYSAFIALSSAMLLAATVSPAFSPLAITA